MTDPHHPDPPDRDPALDAAWKVHSTELPPPRLDAAILAAAHREARTRPQAVGDDDGVAQARGPARAWWGLAAAATIGAIAFGVLQLAPPPVSDPTATVATDVPRATQQRATTPEPPRDPPSALAEAPSADSRASSAAPAAARGEEQRRMSSAPAAETAPAAAPRANAQKPVEAKRRRDAAPERQRDQAVDSTVPAGRTPADAPATASPPAAPEAALIAPRPFPASPPAPPVAAAPASPYVPPGEVAKTEAAGNAVGALRRESGERVAAAEPAPPAAQPARRAQADSARQSAAAEPVAKLKGRTPAAWIERIAALHSAQRFDEAARELNLFREAYPDADAQLPPALRAWAATVKRN